MRAGLCWRVLCLSQPPPVYVVSCGSVGMPRFFCAPSSCSFPGLFWGQWPKSVCVFVCLRPPKAEAQSEHILTSATFNGQRAMIHPRSEGSWDRLCLWWEDTAKVMGKGRCGFRSHTYKRYTRVSGWFFPTTLLFFPNCFVIIWTWLFRENHGFLRA